MSTPPHVTSNSQAKPRARLPPMSAAQPSHSWGIFRLPMSLIAKTFTIGHSKVTHGSSTAKPWGSWGTFRLPTSLIAKTFTIGHSK
eukprot:1140792-Pelagomonas_calceolata.AAC.1